MNILQSSGRQRGVSAWTMIGSLLIVAGMAGLGVALIKPGGQTSGTASIANAGGIAAPPGAATKPAARGEASGQVGRSDAPSGSGPNPNWHGTWRGATPDAQLVITAAMVGKCKWINSTDRSTFDGECNAGYAESSVSLADVALRFEESVAMFQKNPNAISTTEAAQSRGLIGRIKPGNYRVIWTNDGTDCAGGEMIIEGDLILRIVHCGYLQRISLFSRER
jgi:hypothetical protein